MTQSLSNISFASAGELAAKIKNKEISSEQLVQHFIERIQRFNPDLNAVIATNFDDALAQAFKVAETERAEIMEILERAERGTSVRRCASGCAVGASAMPVLPIAARTHVGCSALAPLWQRVQALPEERNTRLGGGQVRRVRL